MIFMKTHVTTEFTWKRNQKCMWQPNLRENVSLLPVDSEYNNCNEDYGQANENGDQEIHVQVEGNNSLYKFGIAT